MNPQNAPDGPVHLAGGKPADEGQFLLGRRLRLVAPMMPAGGGHLVDFGCGNGAQTALLVPLFDRVTGVDVEPAYLEAFRRRIDAEGWGSRVSAAALEGGRIPLADGAADVVTSFTVLEHVPDERAALAEMLRVLKPGGRLIITVPNRWWIFETHGADLPWLPWNRVPLVSWWPKRLHDRWARARIYRLREITALVEAAGFTVVETGRLTAPMDMIPWPSVQRTARRAIFRGDCTPCPFLATEIMVAAER